MYTSGKRGSSLIYVLTEKNKKIEKTHTKNVIFFIWEQKHFFVMKNEECRNNLKMGITLPLFIFNWIF